MHFNFAGIVIEDDENENNDDVRENNLLLLYLNPLNATIDSIINILYITITIILCIISFSSLRL